MTKVSVFPDESALPLPKKPTTNIFSVVLWSYMLILMHTYFSKGSCGDRAGFYSEKLNKTEIFVTLI